MALLPFAFLTSVLDGDVMAGAQAAIWGYEEPNTVEG